MWTMAARTGVETVECLATARAVLGCMGVLGVRVVLVVACRVLGRELVRPLVAVDAALHHAHHGVPLRLAAKTGCAYLLAALHNRLGIGTNGVVAHAIVGAKQGIALCLLCGRLRHALPRRRLHSIEQLGELLPVVQPLGVAHDLNLVAALLMDGTRHAQDTGLVLCAGRVHNHALGSQHLGKPRCELLPSGRRDGFRQAPIGVEPHAGADDIGRLKPCRLDELRQSGNSALPVRVRIACLAYIDVNPERLELSRIRLLAPHGSIGKGSLCKVGVPPLTHKGTTGFNQFPDAETGSCLSLLSIRSKAKGIVAGPRKHVCCCWQCWKNVVQYHGGIPHKKNVVFTETGCILRKTAK